MELSFIVGLKVTAPFPVSRSRWNNALSEEQIARVEAGEEEEGMQGEGIRRRRRRRRKKR